MHIAECVSRNSRITPTRECRQTPVPKAFTEFPINESFQKPMFSTNIPASGIRCTCLVMSYRFVLIEMTVFFAECTYSFRSNMNYLPKNIAVIKITKHIPTTIIVIIADLCAMIKPAASCSNGSLLLCIDFNSFVVLSFKFFNVSLITGLFFRLDNFNTQISQDNNAIGNKTQIATLITDNHLVVLIPFVARLSSSSSSIVSWFILILFLNITPRITGWYKPWCRAV